MKTLVKNEQVLILQREAKAGFLITGFVMLSMAGGLLWLISTCFGIGWWGLLFSPLAIWFLWLALRRSLSNEEIVTVYTLNKGSNQAAIEFKRESRVIALPLHEIRSAEVKLLDVQYMGHGYTHVRFQLYLITNSGIALALDEATGMDGKRELEEIARRFREFLLNY